VIVLALDTSLAACSAAVWDSDPAKLLASRQLLMERGHAEALAPMVRDVLSDAGLQPNQLERIAVTIGPGTFTGVRIGLAMARGLGLALAIPVIGMTTLEAIALNAGPGEHPLAVINDARREENYFALFSPLLEPQRGPEISTLEQAIALLPRGPVRVMGSAAEALIEAAARTDLFRDKNGDLPDAGKMARAAALRAAPGQPPSPLYLRPPDAKPQPSLINRNAIRRAEAHEAMVLAALHAECFERPWTAEEFARLMALPEARALLALEGEEPAGFVLANAAAGEAEILTIATRPQNRRKGHAHKLLEKLSAELKCEQDIRSLFIEVAAGNNAAVALYEKTGFKPVGLRKSYYRSADGNTDDAHIMRKELPA
jgi:tRNA threonylcarbamoyl adenosine modification protein YeaZ/ribosomal-protein-alanine acetyltransferase